MAKSVSELLKFRQLQGPKSPDPPTRGFAPGPHWGQSHQTPNIGSRFALAMNVVPTVFKPYVDTPLCRKSWRGYWTSQTDKAVMVAKCQWQWHFSAIRPILFLLIQSTTVCTIHDIGHWHVLLIFFISSNKPTLITCVGLNRHKKDSLWLKLFEEA